MAFTSTLISTYSGGTAGHMDLSGYMAMEWMTTVLPSAFKESPTSLGWKKRVQESSPPLAKLSTDARSRLYEMQ
jgi:hypothetical protein